MILSQLLPTPNFAPTLSELTAQWQRPCTMPDHATIRNFCAKLSTLLLAEARAFPDLQALGFWLRPANITALCRDYLAAPPQCHLAPLGTVFMIPPANVDALFGYSLAIALLCGNRVIMRLPSQSSAAQDCLLTLLAQVLAETPALQPHILILRYGHDAAITQALSSLCQLRLVWGGDATVATIGHIALPPLARQVGFGDRFSAAAIHAPSYMAADEVTRNALVKRFYNDLYWYDQLACSAPRQLFWLGDEAPTASADFYPRLATYAATQGYQPDMGASVAKLTMEYLALHDLPTLSYEVFSPALSVITIALADENQHAKMHQFKRVNFGYGLLIAVHYADLCAIAKQATAHDQTLTHWGFTNTEIQQLAATCATRGYDRFVPVGQALQFDPVWDGHNLFNLMSRTVRLAN